MLQPSQYLRRPWPHTGAISVQLDRIWIFVPAGEKNTPAPFSPLPSATRELFQGINYELLEFAHAWNYSGMCIQLLHCPMMPLWCFFMRFSLTKIDFSLEISYCLPVKLVSLGTRWLYRKLTSRLLLAEPTAANCQGGLQNWKFGAAERVGKIVASQTWKKTRKRKTFSTKIPNNVTAKCWHSIFIAFCACG